MLPANLALVERPPQTGAACARDRMYTKRTLKALHDAPVGALLSYEALLGERKFEASDVISYGDHYYVVCDSSWAILRVHKSMPLLSAANAQIGAPQDGYEEGDSGFEALVHDATSDSIYVVRESVQAAPAGAGGAKAVSTRAARAIAGEDDDDDAGGAAASAVSWLLSGGQSAAKEAPAGAYHAMVYQLGFEGGLTTATNYSVVDACPSEMEFEGDSKGFEGATSIRGRTARSTCSGCAPRATPAQYFGAILRRNSVRNSVSVARALYRITDARATTAARARRGRRRATGGSW